MKKFVFACMMLAGIGLSAQRLPDHGHHRGKALQNLTSAELATLQSKRMTLALDLTENQEAEIRQLLAQRIESHRENRSGRREAKDSTGHRRHREEDFKSMEDRLDRAIAFRRDVREILTEEQYQQWKQLYDGRNPHRHGRRAPRRR